MVAVVFPSVAIDVAQLGSMTEVYVAFDIDEVRPTSADPCTLRIFGQRQPNARFSSVEPRDFAVLSSARG